MPAQKERNQMPFAGHDHKAPEQSGSIEDRLIKHLEQMRIWEYGHASRVGHAYQNVEDYNPVLTSHCGLTMPSAPPGIRPDASQK